MAPPGRGRRAGRRTQGGEDPVRVVRACAVGEDGAAAMLEMQAGAVLLQGLPKGGLETAQKQV